MTNEISIKLFMMFNRYVCISYQLWRA